jgi:hypothetical protein
LIHRVGSIFAAAIGFGDVVDGATYLCRKARATLGAGIQIELKCVLAYSEGWGLYSENLIKDIVSLMKIGELRNKAQRALGNKFYIRGFHDTLLKSGPVALDVPEEHVDARIALRR